MTMKEEQKSAVGKTPSKPSGRPAKGGFAIGTILALLIAAGVANRRG